MKEIILVGRGGQGAKSAGQIIALVASKNNEVQAFPEFGPERTGAPTKAYVRISKEKIRTTEPIQKADYIIVVDGTIDISDIKLKDGGKIIKNSKNDIPATKIAEKILGKNKPNTVLLGAFCKTAKMDKKAFISSIKEVFGRKLSEEMLKKNIKCFEEGYDLVAKDVF